MKGHRELLKKLLDKYKISFPVPANIQDRILESRKPGLMKILHKSGERSLVTGLSVTINLILRRMGIRIGHSGNYRIASALSFTAASVLVIAGFYGLSKALYKDTVPLAGAPGHVILASGDVFVRHRGRDPEKLKMLDKISRGDTVVTGKDSHLIVQAGLKGIINLSPEAAFEIIALGNKKIEISLKYGRILSKVRAPGEGPQFIIRSPNAAAEAVGTEFSVAFEGNTSTISLGKGRLRITRTGSDEVTAMEEGNTALVSDTIQLRPLYEVEALELKKVSQTDFDFNPEKTGAPELEIRSRTYLQGIIDINRKIDEITGKNRTYMKLKEKELEQLRKLPPLERLRKEGKILTMLHLKDGSRIAGSIVSQDEKEMKFDTADGIIVIPKNDIIRRTPLD